MNGQDWIEAEPANREQNRIAHLRGVIDDRPKATDGTGR
jgi:hypothetical protein